MAPTTTRFRCPVCPDGNEIEVITYPVRGSDFRSPEAWCCRSHIKPVRMTVIPAPSHTLPKD